MNTTPISFNKIIAPLLLSNTKEEEVLAAKDLAQFYNFILEKLLPNQEFKKRESTSIDGGIALSSQYALDCLEDPLRTVRFIKGVHQAIETAFTRFPSEKINILYAGCGPGAPLILPLLSGYKSNQISVTLLDLNESSVESVTTLINELGLTHYFRDILLVDASKYKHPKNNSLHIVLSETMDKGLTEEPQVRITQNLAPQLVKNGILIPEEIRVFTEHSFYSKDPYYDIDKNVLEMGNPIKTIDKQHLFSIKKDISSQPIFSFESNWIKVPEDFKETPDISIFAEIYIFGQLSLKKTESLLGNPYCVISLYSLKSTQYKLIHSTAGIPNWKVIEK